MSEKFPVDEPEKTKRIAPKRGRGKHRPEDSASVSYENDVPQDLREILAEAAETGHLIIPADKLGHLKFFKKQLVADTTQCPQNFEGTTNVPKEISDSFKNQAEALSARLKTPFDIPKTEVSPEVLEHWPKIKETLDEIFGAGNLEAILSPSADQLTDAYFKAMYPPTQTDEDKKNGLVSFRPNWWNQVANTKDANGQLLFPDETLGQVYLRAIRAQAKRLEGKIIFVESIQKPKYIDDKQKYGTIDGADDSKDTLLASLRIVLSNPMMVRFNHTDTALVDTIIPKLTEYIKKKFADKGVPKKALNHINLLLTPNYIFNLQTTILHPYNSGTNCSEWSSTVLEKKDGAPVDRILLSGASGYGGASYVNDRDPADSLGSRGFRLSVVLS